jgi:endonuclease G
MPLRFNMELASRNIAIDPNYPNRKEYALDFLGVRVGLPKPGLIHRPWASPILAYHHFSIVMHRHRRLALFTAANIDGKQIRRLRRKGDDWAFDPRIGQAEQLASSFYDGNGFDLGHLVRRLDPAWGEMAKAANDDTFHLTNAAPQCAVFNRTKPLWAGLEDYLLGFAAQRNGDSGLPHIR